MFPLPVRSSAAATLVSQQHLKAPTEVTVSIPVVQAHTTHRCPNKLTGEDVGCLLKSHNPYVGERN